jgi:hypothetical protein
MELPNRIAAARTRVALAVTFGHAVSAAAVM